MPLRKARPRPSSVEANTECALHMHTLLHTCQNTAVTHIIPLFTCTGDELSLVELSKVQDLLKGLKDDPTAEPFLMPVNPLHYPDYLTIIKQPMDLDTVSKKLEQASYPFVKDVRCRCPFLHPCPRRTLLRRLCLRVSSCSATFS